ncbi:helix-turn-helix transcriptional regulator [Amycolatopsis arida]|uniref:helix-turn-helix transcriptional regulator n=1 Tax=Amycolatopsis arida TaxID=587909 RepID=UPI003C7C81B3
MDHSRSAHIAAVAALGEPNRRRLYEHVVRQPHPVGRDEAAAAVGLPRATAAFHLDRLVDEGLLEVDYQRRTGRTGPGAGRPAKLYHRARRHIGVSLPERRYDLAGHLLAAAVEEADRAGRPPRAVLDRIAHDTGHGLGRDRAGRALLDVLEDLGYEPRDLGAEVALVNCPFSALAGGHAELVCGMNRELLAGLLRGLGRADLSAHLDPRPGHCCVRLRAAPATS